MLVNRDCFLAYKWELWYSHRDNSSQHEPHVATSHHPASMASSFASPEFQQVHVELFNLTLRYLKPMALQCAVELGIPNTIHRHGGAASLADLLATIPVPERTRPFLPRLIRYLSATGILALLDGTEGEAMYSLTPLSRLLVDDVRVNGCTSLGPFVLSQTTKYHLRAAMHLADWFKADDDSGAAEMPFKAAHGGMDFWDATRGDPRFNDVFNAGMESNSKLVLDFVAVSKCGEAFDGVSSLIDVGGGTGGAAKAIARAFPHVKCSVLDLPNVISGIPPGDDDGTVRYIAGDMMNHIPPTDAVLLKYVMHDWNDEDCVRILTQCKKAICSGGGPSGGGKVIIIDTVVGSSAKDMFEAQVSFDMLMMVLTTGKERDEREWGKIFVNAGFKHYKMKPVLGFLSIIELYPDLEI
ncbi:hypothetical protein EJB05_52433, partial [Eragrostis curvula]